MKLNPRLLVWRLIETRSAAAGFAILIALSSSAVALAKHSSDVAGALCLVKNPQGIGVDKWNPDLGTHPDAPHYVASGYIPAGTIVPCTPNYNQETNYLEIPAIHNFGNKAQLHLEPHSASDIDVQYLSGPMAAKRSGPVRGYLDGINNSEIQIFRNPGFSYLNNDDQNRLKSQFVKIKIQKDGTEKMYIKGKAYNLYIVNGVWDANYYDPYQHQNTGELFNKVDLVPNDSSSTHLYLVGRLRHGVITGYLDSMNVTTSPIKIRPPVRPLSKRSNPETEAKATCCEPQSTRTWNSQWQAPRQADKKRLELLAASEIVESNKCLAKKLPNPKRVTVKVPLKKHRFKYRKVLKYPIDPMVLWHKYLEKTAYSSPAKKFDHEPTNDQIARIDLRARTLYGEMGICDSLGPQYMMLVGRVLMNRLNYCKNHPNCEFRSNKSKYSDQPVKFKDLITAYNQINCWDTTNMYLDRMFCVPDNKFDQQAWHDAVQVATELVMDPQNFRAQTNSIGDNTYNYLSPKALPKSRYTHEPMFPAWADKLPPIKNAYATAYPLDNRQYPADNRGCLVLYKDRSK